MEKKTLIYLEDAIDAIDALHDKPNSWLDYAVETIKQLPLAEPERKTGYWVFNKEQSEEISDDVFMCSACHNNEAWGSTECTRYCSYCGAKMLGVKGVEAERRTDDAD